MAEVMDLAWWIAVIGVPLVSALVGADIAIARSQRTENSKLHARIDQCVKDFNDYRVQAATQFATVALMTQMRHELKEGIDKISDKLDRIVEQRIS